MYTHAFAHTLIHAQTHTLVPNTQKKAHSQDNNDRNYNLPTTTSMSKSVCDLLTFKVSMLCSHLHPTID